MATERPSPFTIPNPVFKFAEGAPSEPPPPRSTTLAGLIHNLVGFADFYERATADIEAADAFEKAHHRSGRDANADYYQRCFRATPGIDRVRAYVLAQYGEDLTIGTARRVLGDLTRLHRLSVETAGALALEAAMDRLEETPETTEKPGGEGELAADAGNFIQRLLSGPDDMELNPREMALLEAHLKQPLSLSAIQREKDTTGRSQTQENRNKLKLIRDFNRRLQQTETVDELVSKLYVDRPQGLDPELADAFYAVAVGIRECTRLMATVPYLWTDECEYRRLAACVADAASAARAAYMAVDIRLRRAGGPNSLLEALNDILTVKNLAPLEPTQTPGGLNATLTKLSTKRTGLFARVDGRGCIDRMLDQLARVPPSGERGTEGVRLLTSADPRDSEGSGAVTELPTGKTPGVVSLNVLRTTLEMLGFPDWRKRFESWPEVPFLRLRCAELFPGQPFSPATIELMIAWFQERGLTPNQARHLPLLVHSPSVGPARRREKRRPGSTFSPGPHHAEAVQVVQHPPAPTQRRNHRTRRQAARPREGTRQVDSVPAHDRRHEDASAVEALVLRRSRRERNCPPCEGAYRSEGNGAIRRRDRAQGVAGSRRHPRPRGGTHPPAARRSPEGLRRRARTER